MAGFQHPTVPPASDERAQLLRQCMALILDEIDYGVVLVRSGGTILYANRTAGAELGGSHMLDVGDGGVRLAHARTTARLREAIEAAALHGLRRLVTLEDDERSLSIAVIPLQNHVDDADDGGGGPAPVLLLLGRRRVCEQLSVHWYGVGHGLTPTESSVLDGLLTGLDPHAIARSHNVSLSTVRTQIASLRLKTGTDSIGALIHRAARLPPVVTTLRAARPRAAALAA